MAPVFFFMFNAHIYVGYVLCIQKTFFSSINIFTKQYTVFFCALYFFIVLFSSFSFFGKLKSIYTKEKKIKICLISSERKKKKNYKISAHSKSHPKGLCYVAYTKSPFRCVGWKPHFNLCILILRYMNRA